MTPDVSIIVVSKEDAADLPVSLGSALAQRGAACEALLVDNASMDDSREVARGLGVRVLALPENVGFAAAMNAGIEASSGRYVLALNPDCRLEPDFAAILTRRLDAADARDVGSASGRLLRGDGPELSANGLLDSTGIYFTASGRHFDRGAGEPAALALPRRRGGLRPLGRRGLLPARGPRDARRSRPGTSTRTSFSTARTRTSPGASATSAGAASTFPRPWRTTGGAISPSGAGR